MFLKSLTNFYLSNFLPIHLQYIQYCKSTANASLWVRGNFLCNSYLLTFAFLVFVLCNFFSVFLLHYIRPNRLSQIPLSTRTISYFIWSYVRIIYLRWGSNLILLFMFTKMPLSWARNPILRHPKLFFAVLNKSRDVRNHIKLGIH